MTRLLLLRHAESEWNAEGRWQGWADSPLSEHGERQAGLAAAALMKLELGFTTLVASDLQRARLTAALMASALGLTGSLVLEPGLREYDVGRWSGLTRPQIEAGWPGALDDWRHGRLVATPGGETRDGFVARIAATVSRLGSVHQGETVLVVTHGGVITALERSLGCQPRRVPHLSGRWIDAGAEGLGAGDAMTLDAEFDRQASPHGRSGVADGEATDFPRDGALARLHE